MNFGFGFLLPIQWRNPLNSLPSPKTLLKLEDLNACMLKLAIIGCGDIARQHLEAYKQIKEKEPEKFEFTAMCDMAEEAAERFASFAADVQNSKPRVYTKVEDLLSKEQIDAADICTPHFLHHIVGNKCLDAGVNIMVEKPFGVTIKASKTLIDAAKRNSKIACVAEQIRRSPGARTAHWLINDNKMIGEPRLLYAQSVGWHAPQTGR